jgi:hypothetical protein
MEKPHHYRCAAKLFDAKPLRLAAFREYRQSKYVLEHILRPSIDSRMHRWPLLNSRDFHALCLGHSLGGLRQCPNLPA